MKKESSSDEHLMLMDRACEKLEAAKDLMEDGHFSDSVSRAYYAMFFAARALLCVEGIYPKTHRGVMSKLAEEYVSKGGMSQVVFRRFASSQEEREKADYGLLSDMSKQDAEDALKAAECFLEAARCILKGKKQDQSSSGDQ